MGALKTHTIVAKERAKTKKQSRGESQEENEKFNRNLLINVVELKPQIIVVCLFFFFSLATAALVARYKQQLFSEKEKSYVVCCGVNDDDDRRQHCSRLRIPSGQMYTTAHTQKTNSFNSQWWSYPKPCDDSLPLAAVSTVSFVLSSPSHFSLLRLHCAKKYTQLRHTKFTIIYAWEFIKPFHTSLLVVLSCVVWRKGREVRDEEIHDKKQWKRRAKMSDFSFKLNHITRFQRGCMFFQLLPCGWLVSSSQKMRLFIRSSLT